MNKIRINENNMTDINAILYKIQVGTLILILLLYDENGRTDLYPLCTGS